MKYTFSLEDLEMLKAFVEETWDFIQKIEEEVLSIESCTDITNCLNDIFRQMHTIKGLSSFFGFSDITRLSHQAEFMLDALRSDKLQPSSKVVTLLLNTGDALVELIGQVKDACEVTPLGDLLEVELNSTKNLNSLIEEMQQLILEEDRSGSINQVQNDGIRNQIPSPGRSSDDELLKVIKEQVSGVAVAGFLEEAQEHIAVITDLLLITLDREPKNFEALADLFRRIHTIKGNLGLLLSIQSQGSSLIPAIKSLLEIFQGIEGLLDRIRDRKTAINQAIVNLCFHSMDSLQKLMDMVTGSEQAEQAEIDGLLTRIAAVQEEFSKINAAKGSRKTKTSSGARGEQQQGCPEQGPSEQDPVEQDTFEQGRPEHTPSQQGNSQQGAAKTSASDLPGLSMGHYIRVSEEKVNKLMNVIGELAVTKNAFSEIARKLLIQYNLAGMSREMKEIGQWVTRISNELENTVMAMRMTEVRQVFQKFPRIVRDIALKSNKSMTLIMEGEDTELDKTIIEQIGDPLLHLVRNAADHGIESVEQRTAAGKEPRGNIWLRAYNQGKYVIIEVEDDGRGMDPEALKAKAIQKGFITPAQGEEMSEFQALNLILLPGFSTAANVSEISGRGVGMDVVRNNITALRGSIQIASTLGKGSKFTMQMPLTLAVSRGLLVGVGTEKMILPLDNVIETLKIPGEKLAIRKGRMVLVHRNEVLGIVPLANLLGDSANVDFNQKQSIVILGDGVSRVGVVVDSLLNEQDVLIKPLDEMLANVPGMGGATIMGDGKIALVLNAVELIKIATGQLKRRSAR